MVHDCSTRGRKQEILMMNQDSQTKDIGNNILSCINSLKDEMSNLKEIAIKYLQNENEKLWEKCERLERHCAKCESDHIALAQYGHWNDVVLRSISNPVSDNTLEESVISILTGIHVLGHRSLPQI